MSDKADIDSYDKKFDPKKPQPGDEDLAKMLRQGKELAMKNPYGSESIACSCGKAFQSADGWAAQGLFEDLPNGKAIHHNLPPEPCVEVET